MHDVTPCSADITTPITLAKLRKIYELLEQIEHPTIWYSDTHLDMANEAIRYCAHTALEIKELLPVMDWRDD